MGCGSSTPNVAQDTWMAMAIAGVEGGALSEEHAVTRKEILKVVNSKGTFEEKYHWGPVGREKLAGGAANMHGGSMYKAYMAGTGVPVVVRETLHTDEEDCASVRESYCLYKKLTHQNIIELLEVYEEDGVTFGITPFLNGVSLFHWVADRLTWTEGDCRTIITNVATAVAHMHANHVLHCDIRAESIVVVRGVEQTEEGEDVRVVVGAVLSNMDHIVKLKRVSNYFTVGNVEASLPHAAPELVNGKPYSYPSDMWSVGIVLYVLMCGYHPFQGSHDMETARNIETGNLSFHRHLGWAQVSQGSQDLIRALLHADPEQRPTAADVLKDKWIKRQGEQEGHAKAAVMLATQRRSVGLADKERTRTRTASSLDGTDTYNTDEDAHAPPDVPVPAGALSWTTPTPEALAFNDERFSGSRSVKSVHVLVRWQKLQKSVLGGGVHASPGAPPPAPRGFTLPSGLPGLTA